MNEACLKKFVTHPIIFFPLRIKMNIFFFQMKRLTSKNTNIPKEEGKKDS